jgi:type IV pilus assembly protein PilY1
MQQRLSVRFLVTLLLGLGCLGYVPHVAAALLELSDVPLSLSIKVRPNILFLIDNTGSMDYEVMTKDAISNGRLSSTQPDGSSPACSGSLISGHDGKGNACTFTGKTSDLGYIYGTQFPGNAYASSPNCTIADDQEWRFRNSDFNPLYYNPAKIYKPWPGLRTCDGKPYPEFSPSAAPDDPNDCNSKTRNLLSEDSLGNASADGFSYYTWANTYNYTDPNDAANTCQNTFDGADTITRHRIKDKDTATQQNFANWFSYHRRRSSEVKAIVGNTIASAGLGQRMGLSFFSHGTDTPITDMTGDATSGTKGNLLQKLYSYKVDQGTKALLNSLYDVGLYFKNSNSSIPGFNGDPYLPADQGGTCQQSFVILLTDGPYDDSLNKVGNTDGDCNTTFDCGAYKDGFSNTAADVAMYFYEKDLRSDLADKVPTNPGLDTAKHQHMVTYALTFGATGTLTSNPADSSKSFTWPDPNPKTGNSSAAKIDDLRHAAYNSRGLFLRTTNPDELEAALKAALNDIEIRTSSAASVALNSGTRTTDTYLYQARFTSGTWNGQLLAFPIQTDGSLGTAAWDAGEVIKGQNFDTDRTILTYNPSTKSGVPFRWNSLTTDQQTALHTDSTGVNDGYGSARLDYLRGSNANEGTGVGKLGYRVRVSPLADLLNSDPVYVGAPPLPDSIGPGYGYAAFRSAYSNRTPLILVGGNDGFLHVFHAKTGQELLAYMPTVLFKKLSQLTSPTYQHRYYVDGSPTVGDAYIDIHGNGAKEWRTVAVSGLRAGGQGYFALDITDPSTFSESNASKLVLWEFTDKDDPDLGFTFNQPSIVRMANGRWAAVFGNGYNDLQSDVYTSATGHAVLFIAFLDGGLDGTWTQGTDYIKIDTLKGDLNSPNGLATPAAVDTNADSTVEYIVAGDLQGNVWTFDVRDTDPSKWKVEYVDGSNKPAPLFIAKDAAGNPQPITSRPEVGEHPEKLGGFVVYIGTGKYLELNDTYTTSQQTFYSIWDKNEQPLTSFGRSALLQQTVIAEPVVNGQTVRVTSDNTIDWEVQRGWYIDLPATGERSVTDSVLRNGQIIFTTLIPNQKICQFGGSSFLMELDVNGGRRPPYPTLDINGDHKVDSTDVVSVTINGQTAIVIPPGIGSTEGILSSPTVLSSGATEMKYSTGSTGGVFVVIENPGPRAHGRQAWRQLK